MAHKRLVIALGVALIVVGAAGSLASILKWEGRGAVVAGLIGVGVIVLLGLLKDAIVPAIEIQGEKLIQSAQARAVDLWLTKNGDLTSLMMLSATDHAVKDVRVDCYPTAGPGELARPAPAFEPAHPLNSDIEYTTLAPDGQSITVKRLLPGDQADRGTGVNLGSYLVFDNARTRMEFAVAWLDNTERRHSLVGVADLRDIPVAGPVQLDPPPPLTTRPTWWWRLRTRLLRPPASTGDH